MTDSRGHRGFWGSTWGETFARPGAVRLAIVLLALVGLFGGNTSERLTLDPVHYAAVARQMAEGGDWVVPRFAGEPYLKKPPLVMWLSAASMKVFGFSGFAATLPAVLLGFVGVLLAARLATRLFDRETALLAAVILVTSYSFLRSARTLRLETIVIVTTLGALLVYLRAAERPRAPWWTGFAFFGLVAAGFLGKSYAGLMPLGLVLLGVPRRKVLASPWFWIGAVAFVLPVGAWLLGVRARLGPDWLAAFAADVEQYEGQLLHVGKFVERMLVDTILQNLPWSALVIVSGAAAVRTLFRRGDPDRGRNWLLLLFLLLVAVASIPKERQYSRYWVPAFPALAILAGRWLRVRLGGRSFAPFTAFVTGAVLFVCLGLTVLPVRTTGEPHRYAQAAPAIRQRLGPDERLAFVGRSLSIGRQATIYFYSGHWAEIVPPDGVAELSGSGRLTLFELEDLPRLPPGLVLRRVYEGDTFVLAEVR